MSRNITIIGTGNLAWYLAAAFEQAGHVIHEIYGRSETKAIQIGKNLNNPVITDSLDFSRSSSCLFIIAVSDKAIESVASEIILPENALLVHTSGTVPMSALELAGIDHIGVFYPLQTFSKNREINFLEVPLLIEACDETTQKQLENIATSVSSNVTLVNSDDRLGIHLAAVFANNFTNHMIDIAGQVLEKNALDLDLLEPLIRETIEKALDQNPSTAQTGPAIRGDTDTMDMHLAQLGFDPRYQALYRSISESIREGRSK